VLLAHERYNGDLDQVGLALRQQRECVLPTDHPQRKLSHLRDLQQRLVAAGIGVPKIVSALHPAMAAAERRRAYGRIIKHNQRSYELSAPMRTLPEERLYAIALRGLWAPFPASPQPFYAQLRATFNWERFHGKHASWGLARKLDAATAFARQLRHAGKFADALAALRSIMTVALELVQQADDSCGCIGMSFHYAFDDYLAIPRDKAGIAPEAFLTDLLELLLFEDAGFTYGRTDGFFARVSRADAQFAITYLRGRIHVLTALDLDCQAAKALTLIGQIAAEQKWFELFEPLATEMGTRAWQRIIRLADAAVKARKRDLADRIFRAALADQHGDHARFLAQKHTQLRQGKWSPDPRK